MPPDQFCLLTFSDKLQFSTAESTEEALEDHIQRLVQDLYGVMGMIKLTFHASDVAAKECVVSVHPKDLAKLQASLVYSNDLSIRTTSDAPLSLDTANTQA